MELKDFKFIRSRMVMVSRHGREYEIKKHKGKERWYIQHAVGQLTVTDVVRKKEFDYNVFYHYLLCGLRETHPCVVQEWWLKMSIRNKYINFKNYKNELQ